MHHDMDIEALFQKTERDFTGRSIPKPNGSFSIYPMVAMVPIVLGMVAAVSVLQLHGTDLSVITYQAALGVYESYATEVGEWVMGLNGVFGTT